MAGAKINFRRLARDVVPRRRVRVDVSRASSDETDAMDGLLVLGAVAKAHAESKWVRVPIEEVLDEVARLWARRAGARAPRALETRRRSRSARPGARSGGSDCRSRT